MKTKLLIVLVLFVSGISPVFASEPEIVTSKHYQPDVELLPDKKIEYGESFTIHAWLSTYENRPDNLGFFVDVWDSEHNQVDSTLWFARDDFVYEFDTTHPAYNITKGGTYFIKIEKADSKQRTGSFYKTLEFEIDYINNHPSPLKQFKSGIPLHEIQCNDDRILIHQKSTLKPACVFHDSELIFERKWAAIRIGMPAEVITQEKLCFWYSEEMPKYLAPYCGQEPPFEEEAFIELVKNAGFDKEVGHYDYLPVNNNPNMMAMETIQLRDDDSIKVKFGQNNYEWSTGYKPIPYFEYVANFKVNDTFVILCTNVGKDGYADFHPGLSEPYLPTLGIVKYLGPITIENEPILLFWHESISLLDDIPCSYPEMIHHSINLWQLQEQGLPTDSLENALGSKTTEIAPVVPEHVLTCKNNGGKWIEEFDECELFDSKEMCEEMGGMFDECASACRNDPNYPNVACTDNCVEVCSFR